MRVCVSRKRIRPIGIAELMGHRDVKTTLTVYAHLINTDDHAANMAAVGVLAAPKPSYEDYSVALLWAGGKCCSAARLVGRFAAPPGDDQAAPVEERRIFESALRVRYVGLPYDSAGDHSVIHGSKRLNHQLRHRAAAAPDQSRRLISHVG